MSHLKFGSALFHPCTNIELIFFINESKQNGHQSNARIAPSCVQPGHIRHVQPGSHHTEATSPEQRDSPSAGIRDSGGLRPLCWE